MIKRLIFVLFIFASVKGTGQNTFSLNKCLDIALENNISLSQGELNIQQSELGLIQSKANLLPSLNGSASHGYNWGQTIDPFTNQFATNRIQSNSFGLNTGVTIFNGFTLQNRIKQADLNVKISQLGLESSINTIALAVANAYLSVLFNQEINTANLANRLASKEQVDRIKLLVEAGQVPDANLYQVEAQLAQDEARVINSENAISLAKLSLMQLIQLPEEQKKDFGIETPNLNEPLFNLPSKNSVVLNALGTFPEVKSAELIIARADLEYKIANGGRYPRLGASYNYGSGFSGANQKGVGELVNFGNVPIGTLSGSNQLVFSLDQLSLYSDFETVPFFNQVKDNVNRSMFFSLNIPIFNGLSNRTNVQMARIGQANAKLESLNVRNQLRQTVETAFADATAAYKTYEAADYSLRAQKEAFKYAKIRYEEQVINGVDYAQARSLRDSALSEKIRSQYDYVFKLKILEFYQGKTISLN
jgi:outer membrane protein